MKHTKGEWAVDKNSKENFVYCNGHLICTPALLLPDNEIEANAKLIAAAPNLLKAVKATDAFFDDMPKGQFGNLVFDVGLMNEMFISISKSIKNL